MENFILEILEISLSIYLECRLFNTDKFIRFISTYLICMISGVQMTNELLYMFFNMQINITYVQKLGRNNSQYFLRILWYKFVTYIDWHFTGTPRWYVVRFSSYNYSGISDLKMNFSLFTDKYEFLQSYFSHQKTTQINFVHILPYWTSIFVILFRELKFNQHNDKVLEMCSFHIGHVPCKGSSSCTNNK